MTLITRYFAPTAAGAGDGTSAANAAALFSGGAWSTVITGFAFNGTNSLECRVMPGTYTITAILQTSSFTNAPSATNPLILSGADSSGSPLTPPYGWTADQPAWDASALPVIATTTNIGTISLSQVVCRMLKFTASGRTGGAVVSSGIAIDWCYVTSSSAGTSAQGLSSAANATNSVVSMSGSSYDVAVILSNGNAARNCQIAGVAGAGGNRRGVTFQGTTSPSFLEECLVAGHGGPGYISASANVAQQQHIRRCVICGNGGDGIQLASTASQTVHNTIYDNAITGNGGFGINLQSAALAQIVNNRLRDNTSGNFGGLLNESDYNSYTTAATDADDYNNAAGGDYRIKSTAGFANRNIGVSQMPSAAIAAPKIWTPAGRVL